MQWRRKGILTACALLLCVAGKARAAVAPQSTIPGSAGNPLQLSEDPLAMARDLMQNDRFSAAEQSLRLVLMHDPDSAEAHQMLGYALLRQDKPREALEEYTRAAQLATPTATMLVHVGQAYVLLNDFDDADTWTERAVRMDPQNADAWYGLGRIRYTRQKFADAEACFKHVLALVPHSVKAEDNLGLVYEAENRPDAALAAYRQAVAWEESGPAGERSEQPLINLGTFLEEHGELASAEPLLLEAASLAPSNERVHEQLGHVYLQEQRYADARREFQEACRLEPGQASLHFLLGQADKRLGQEQQAQIEFETAKKLAGTSSQ